MSGSQPFSQIDAFIDRPFAGNPAAVCVLPAPRDDGCWPATRPQPAAERSWCGVAGERVHLGGQAVTVLRGELLH
jgi:predicted PhzF superfamily epimerase YddE/YHI9